VYEEKSHHITEDGRKRCPETGADYSDYKTSKERLADLYKEETCQIIVLDYQSS